MFRIIDVKSGLGENIPRFYGCNQVSFIEIAGLKNSHAFGWLGGRSRRFLDELDQRACLVVRHSLELGLD